MDLAEPYTRLQLGNLSLVQNRLNRARRLQVKVKSGSQGMVVAAEHDGLVREKGVNALVDAVPLNLPISLFDCRVV